MSVNSFLLLYYTYLCISLETPVVRLGLFIIFAQKFISGGYSKNVLVCMVKELFGGCIFSGLKSKALVSGCGKEDLDGWLRSRTNLLST